jgi:hypothetical protein
MRHVVAGFSPRPVTAELLHLDQPKTRAEARDYMLESMEKLGITRTRREVLDGLATLFFQLTNDLID